ncbi:MAG: peptidase S10, partial [Candidatus Latescibacteria bacterium]|nr:peptidase S10 [Candidatus Latescibacterota bacterium]
MEQNYKGKTTEHQISFSRSLKLSYTAVADWMTLYKKEKPLAKMFHVAYMAKKQGAKKRPITFVFNGGPGAASAYLHMGALGPRRAVFQEDGTLPKPPTQVVSNVDSWLRFTDLVFIDPIGTGFSRMVEEEKKADEGE